MRYGTEALQSAELKPKGQTRETENFKRVGDYIQYTGLYASKNDVEYENASLIDPVAEDVQYEINLWNDTPHQWIHRTGAIKICDGRFEDVYNRVDGYVNIDGKVNVKGTVEELLQILQ